jgi:hypothetical protein
MAQVKAKPKISYFTKLYSKFRREVIDQRVVDSGRLHQGTTGRNQA